MPHIPILQPHEELYTRMAFPSAPNFIMESMVQDVNHIPDPKLRDMILFSLKCSRDPQSLIERDYEQLRQHGLTRSEIREIVAMSAFAVYANVIADATAMEPDEMFATI